MLNGVAAVQQLTLVAVNIGDGRLAGCSRQKTRVIRKHAGLSVQLANVDHVWAHAAVINRHFNTGTAVTERQGCFVISELHGVLLSIEWEWAKMWMQITEESKAVASLKRRALQK